MLRKRSWPAVSQKSVMQNQLRMTQLTKLCFSHNLHPRGKAQPTCSGTQTEFHLTSLKQSRVKKLCQTGIFSQLWAVLSCGLCWHWPSTKEKPPVTRVVWDSRTKTGRSAKSSSSVWHSVTRDDNGKLPKTAETTGHCWFLTQ